MIPEQNSWNGCAHGIRKSQAKGQPFQTWNDFWNDTQEVPMKTAVPRGTVRPKRPCPWGLFWGANSIVPFHLLSYRGRVERFGSLEAGAPRPVVEGRRGRGSHPDADAAGEGDIEKLEINPMGQGRWSMVVHVRDAVLLRC